MLSCKTNLTLSISGDRVLLPVHQALLAHRAPELSTLPPTPTPGRPDMHKLVFHNATPSAMLIFYYWLYRKTSLTIGAGYDGPNFNDVPSCKFPHSGLFSDWIDAWALVDPYLVPEFSAAVLARIAWMNLAYRTTLIMSP